MISILDDETLIILGYFFIYCCCAVCLVFLLQFIIDTLKTISNCEQNTKDLEIIKKMLDGGANNELK